MGNTLCWTLMKLNEAGVWRDWVGQKRDQIGPKLRRAGVGLTGLGQTNLCCIPPKLGHAGVGRTELDKNGALIFR